MEDHPFTEGKGRPDVVLVVGDQRFHVNKSVLMVASPVFEKMFGGEFKERDATEVPLEEEDPKQFLTFLKCLYPSVNQPVTAQNALAVVKVADEYQVESLIQLCDTVLAEHCSTLDLYKANYSALKFRLYQTPEAARVKSTILTYIEAAEKCGLQELLPVCTSKAVGLNSGEIKKSKTSKETQLEIYKRRVEALENLITSLDKVGHNKEHLYKEFSKFRTGQKNTGTDYVRQRTFCSL